MKFATSRARMCVRDLPSSTSVSPPSKPTEWQSYTVEEFDFLAFEANARVLDVGCGPGDQLDGLTRRGVRAVGVDCNGANLTECRRRGFAAIRAVAEALPLRADSVDGVVCKVVVPYTHERAVFPEIARVLRRDGVARCAFIGAGYYLRCLLWGPSWRARLYGLRTLLNTWVFALTGRRLPSWCGDTLYQSRRRLLRYYSENGLDCIEDWAAKRFCSFPVFIYQTLRRGPAREQRR